MGYIVSFWIALVTKTGTYIIFNIQSYNFRTYKDEVVDYLNNRDVDAKLKLEEEHSQHAFSFLKVSFPIPTFLPPVYEVAGR